MSMTQEITHEGNRKVTTDDMNPRIYHEEWKCHGCKEWVDNDEVNWATEDGKLTMHGNPYCDSCLPEEV